MAISLIQSGIKDVKLANNTTLAFPFSLTAGNTLYVSIAWWDNTTGLAIAAPTDSLGHTYLPACAEQSTNDNRGHIRSWLVSNCSAGANTITADISGTSATSELTVAIAELSGILTASPLSVASVLAGPSASTTPSTGNITPVHDACILIGSLNAEGSLVTITPGSGWTQIQEYEGNNGSMTLSMIYKIQTTAAADAANWTLSVSHTCLRHVAALRPAVGGGIVRQMIEYH